MRFRSASQAFGTSFHTLPVASPVETFERRHDGQQTPGLIEPIAPGFGVLAIVAARQCFKGKMGKFGQVRTAILKIRNDCLVPSASPSVAMARPSVNSTSAR